MAAAPLSMVVTIRIIRRSNRSDSRPTGHCNITPPMIITLMKLEIWATDRPILSPYTAARP